MDLHFSFFCTSRLIELAIRELVYNLLSEEPRGYLRFSALTYSLGGLEEWWYAAFVSNFEPANDPIPLDNGDSATNLELAFTLPLVVGRYCEPCLSVAMQTVWNQKECGFTLGEMDDYLTVCPIICVADRSLGVDIALSLKPDAPDISTLDGSNILDYVKAELFTQSCYPSYREAPKSPNPLSLLSTTQAFLFWNIDFSTMN